MADRTRLETPDTVPPARRLPVCRKPRLYAADKDNPGREPDDCNKFVRMMRGMTEGLLCMFCPHGICIGFTILTRHEGPRIAFELIMTRFKRAPAMIVYDNACSLHAYCMKRERAFFARTKFRVDRMHFKGHKGCTWGYDLDYWPGRTPVIGADDMLRVSADVRAWGGGGRRACT